MSPFDRIDSVANEILTSGVLDAAQRCQQLLPRPERISHRVSPQDWQALHERLRTAWERVGEHQEASVAGSGPSRLGYFVAVVEAVREVVRFGTFDDVRHGLAAGVERMNYLLLEQRARAALESVDALTRHDTRTAVEKIRDHLQAAEAIWDEFSREEREEFHARQVQANELSGAGSLRDTLAHAVSAAEQLVHMQEQPEGARP